MRDFYIAGVQFHKSVSIQDKLKEGDELTIRPEPTNKFDPNAVALLYLDEDLGDVMVGYVPAKFSGEISALLLTAEEVTCTLTEVNLTNKTWERFRVEIKEVE